jgi:hypothetical protein
MSEDSNTPKPKLSKAQIKAALWLRGDLTWKMHAVQKEMYRNYLTSPENGILVWLLSRQTGKCVKSGTYVATPNGPVKIEDIKVGDYVIGYNFDGTTSPTEVKQVHSQGKKSVVDLMHRGRTVASVTKDHRWLGFNTFTKKTEVLTSQALIDSGHKKIKREYFDHHWGDVHEPHAYAIGALLGDGYGKHNNTRNQISISSETPEIPEAVARELGYFYWKQSGNNYSWIISSIYKPGAGKKTYPIESDLYHKWCGGKLAHEKYCELDVIKTWTRESQLRFIAGLLDTDGSIFVTGRSKNELKFSLGMQAKSVVDAVKYLFLYLWQIELCEVTDNRPKYKNGPVYTVYSNNNFCVKRALKELSPHLVLERKKYKPEYDSFPDYNHVPDYCGVVAGEEYEVDTYDLGIDNGTHLYCLANGLVTHNSYCLTLISLMEAIRYPNAIIKMVTDTKVHMEAVIEPLFREILEDGCPPEIMPEYNKTKGVYYFPNGSQIQLAGSDGNSIERLRGQKSRLVLVDEAGFCTDLNNAIYSVLLPTTTHTGGRVILASTPPEDLSHHFVDFIQKAESEDLLIKKTVYDNPLLSPDQVQGIINRFPLKENDPRFRREYMVELIKDEDKAVIPEATDELMEEITTAYTTHPHPTFKDAYVSMDLGFKDLTITLFGYYDFRNDLVVIQSELWVEGKSMKLPEYTEKIGAKEEELWTNPLTNEFNPPVIRVSDINYLVTQEMYRASDGKVNFIPFVKTPGYKLPAINNLRVMLSGKKILINPECKTLIRHLKYARWKDESKKDDFARSADNSHADAIDALLYFILSVNYNRNPYPAGHGLDTSNLYVRNPQNFYRRNSDPQEIIRSIFNPNRKR